jgi:hypothetical protein
MAEIFSRAEFWRRHDAINRATRDDDRAAREALHDEYWGQYLEVFRIKAPANMIEASERAWRAGDRWFNSPYTTLQQWDCLEHRFRQIPGLVKTLRENGEAWSLSVSICLLKSAMRRHMIAAGVPFGEG